MFFRILRKSLGGRKGKVLIAVIAVMMGAAIPSAMITVSMDIDDKVSQEFRKYGANLIIVPRSDTIQVGLPGVEFGSVTEQRYINESDLWKIRSIHWRKNVLGFSPFLYQVIKATGAADDQEVVLVGTYFNRDVDILEPYSPDDATTFNTGLEKISPWWSVKGAWLDDPDDGNASMVGQNVARKLGLGIGDRYMVSYSEVPGDTRNASERELRVVAIMSTGGNEDDQIYVDLDVAQALSSRPDKVHTVQVSALCNMCPVNTFAEEIEEKIPYADARTVKQLVNAEMSVLSKVEKMFLLVSVVALLASVLGVGTTMTAGVVERQREIGLMKSLGAENGRIASLFFTEAALTGFLGGISGYGVGLIVAQFVGISVFGSSAEPRLIVLPLIVGISIGIALLASAFPVRRAIRIEPVVVLRGE